MYSIVAIKDKKMMLWLEFIPLHHVILLNVVGERSIILKFATHHQDQSMESSSNRERGVHLHTLVDRERKRSRERG